MKVIDLKNHLSKYDDASEISLDKLQIPKFIPNHNSDIIELEGEVISESPLIINFKYGGKIKIVEPTNIIETNDMYLIKIS